MFIQKAERIVRTIFIILLLTSFLGRSQVSPANQQEKIRAYSRMIEFDYTTWTIDALFGKAAQSALGMTQYISSDSAKEIVLEYLKIVDQTQQIQSEIERIYADPEIKDPEGIAAEKLAELVKLQDEKADLANLAESIIQAQVSQVISEMGLSFAGQPVPPLLYHVTELPLSLIVSPREVIRQDANISIDPELSLVEITKLEKDVANGLNVSTMVTRIGGVGVYPTMVGQSTSLQWLIEVVAHEWIHNYLTMRPLGIRYDSSPELRTMNETTANIAGNEIGLLVLQKYYPEMVPPPVEPSKPEDDQKVEDKNPPEPPEFDFNKEMHETRVKADELLAEGKIDEAEKYMEARRKVFWDHGYQIRVLNQAYFAFHGAYADVPGGAAGEDLVGPAVRKLREESPTLKDFVNRIAEMRTFDELQKAVQ
jgi:hypothetical protein